MPNTNRFTFHNFWSLFYCGFFSGGLTNGPGRTVGNSSLSNLGSTQPQQQNRNFSSTNVSSNTANGSKFENGNNQYARSNVPTNNTVSSSYSSSSLVSNCLFQSVVSCVTYSMVLTFTNLALRCFEYFLSENYIFFIIPSNLIEVGLKIKTGYSTT